MKFLTTMFTKLRGAFVRARARWISRRWVRKIVKGGEVEVVPFEQISDQAISNLVHGREIDEAFFADDEYQGNVSTVELRWLCADKAGGDFGRFMQRPDETPLDYRARLKGFLQS